jgi:PKD repeat protein
MKKILPLIVLMAIMFSSCYYYEDIEPYADFTASSSLVEPYEVIFFSNHSSDADNYFWDFGDGFTSNSFNPEHYYDVEGTYTVSLRVQHHNGGSDVAYMDIEVYYTDLEITVAEWNRGLDLDNLIPDAEVTIYETYDDWYTFSHPIDTRYTNSDGVAFFHRVDPIVYYIDVYHTYYDNSVLGQEDVSWIETDRLAKAEINTFVAWVDYFPPTIQQRSNGIRVPYKLDREKRAYQKVEAIK